MTVSDHSLKTHLLLVPIEVRACCGLQPCAQRAKLLHQDGRHHHSSSRTVRSRSSFARRKSSKSSGGEYRKRPCSAIRLEQHGGPRMAICDCHNAAMRLRRQDREKGTRPRLKSKSIALRAEAREKQVNPAIHQARATRLRTTCMPMSRPFPDLFAV